jgi:CHAT domain-containing protein
MTRPRVALAAADRAGELRRYRYLLIAAHGRLDAANPLASAVVLGADAAADGCVTAAEWPGYHLDSEARRAVSLRNRPRQARPEERASSGSRSRFAAGNRSTAMTLWQVDDDSSARVITGLFGELRRGTSQAGAGDAKRALWRDPPPGTRSGRALVLYGG